jgi:transglutaminase-like putative cysteine protease
MLLTVRHDTSYAYDGFAAQIAQILRLTPRSHVGQDVIDWRVSRSDGAPIATYFDGLGNICGFSSRRGPMEGVVISVAGRVRTEETDGLVKGADEPLPPAYFLRRTAATGASDTIRALAADAMKGETGRAALSSLMAAVRERMAYAPSQRHTDVTAEAALGAGRGSAKDLAHVFIAAARHAGAPARYVGGYLWRGAEDHDELFAAHAWAEAYVQGEGWASFDPAVGAWSGAAHIRVAVGLDHRQAAPISGLWRGEGVERMSVEGAVEMEGGEQ